MPRDGSRNYTLPEAPFVANTVIDPTDMNSNFSDIATALTDSFTRAETTSFSRNLLDDTTAGAACQTLGVGWERLAIRVLASGTWEEFALDSAFQQFQILVTRGASTTSAFGAMQLSQNGGATWISSAASYVNTQMGVGTSGTPAGSLPTSASSAFFAPTLTATNSGVSGTIDLDAGAVNHVAMFRSCMTAINSASIYANPSPWTNSAYCVTTGRANRIRLGWSAGNWDGVGRSARLILLGMRAV
jgi:hypothetical protein